MILGIQLDESWFETDETFDSLDYDKLYVFNEKGVFLIN